MQSAKRLEEMFDLQQMDKDVTEAQVDDMFDKQDEYEKEASRVEPMEDLQLKHQKLSSRNASMKILRMMLTGK